MATVDERDAGFTSSRLDDRVLTTLQGLGGRIAFSGLRRVLGVHPESLSRALRRLEREGLIARGDGGYRSLTGPGAVPASGRPNGLRAVASVELGPGSSAELVEARLVGRWFGDLRWVGVVERDEGRLLAWDRRDESGTVLLGTGGGVLRVYLPEPSLSADVSEGDDAAYELLVHAVSALRLPAGPLGDVQFLRSTPEFDLGGPTEN